MTNKIDFYILQNYVCLDPEDGERLIGRYPDFLGRDEKKRLMKHLKICEKCKEEQKLQVLIIDTIKSDGWSLIDVNAAKIKQELSLKRKNKTKFTAEELRKTIKSCLIPDFKSLQKEFASKGVSSLYCLLALNLPEYATLAFSPGEANAKGKQAFHNIVKKYRTGITNYLIERGSYERTVRGLSNTTIEQICIFLTPQIGKMAALLVALLWKKTNTPL